eukprot:9182013-Prorocentrum_lima.AAC.1
MCGSECIAYLNSARNSRSKGKPERVTNFALGVNRRPSNWPSEHMRLKEASGMIKGDPVDEAVRTCLELYAYSGKHIASVNR